MYSMSPSQTAISLVNSHFHVFSADCVVKEAGASVCVCVCVKRGWVPVSRARFPLGAL